MGGLSSLLSPFRIVHALFSRSNQAQRCPGVQHVGVTLRVRLGPGLPIASRSLVSFAALTLRCCVCHVPHAQKPTNHAAVSPSTSKGLDLRVMHSSCARNEGLQPSDASSADTAAFQRTSPTSRLVTAPRGRYKESEKLRRRARPSPGSVTRAAAPQRVDITSHSSRVFHCSSSRQCQYESCFAVQPAHGPVAS